MQREHNLADIFTKTTLSNETRRRLAEDILDNKTTSLTYIFNPFDRSGEYITPSIIAL